MKIIMKIPKKIMRPISQKKTTMKKGKLFLQK